MNLRLTKQSLNEFMASLSNDKALFHIQVYLTAPDITIIPNEIGRTVIHVVNDFIQR